MSRIDLLKLSAEEFHIHLSDLQLEQFDLYYHLLIEWNEKMNLTAITKYDDVVIKHFLDSIAIGKFISFPDQATLLDVGTGAGFPGIPLKILFPNLTVVLLDSLNKRVLFLNHVIDQLHLSKITACHGRAEDFAKDEDYREKFDFVVSRAVANLSSLSEICLPFVKVGALFISYKSEKAEEEMVDAGNAIHLCGGELKECFSFHLHSDFERKLICIKKLHSTPMKFPRKAGIPFKKPL